MVLGYLVCRFKSWGDFRLHFCFPYPSNTEHLDARGTVHRRLKKAWTSMAQSFEGMKIIASFFSNIVQIL